MSECGYLLQPSTVKKGAKQDTCISRHCPTRQRIASGDGRVSPNFAISAGATAVRLGLFPPCSRTWSLPRRIAPYFKMTMGPGSFFAVSPTEGPTAAEHERIQEWTTYTCDSTWQSAEPVPWVGFSKSQCSLEPANVITSALHVRLIRARQVAKVATTTA